MSVTPMKLCTVVGPLGEFDNVVRDCIINREFHPESAISVMKKVKFLFAFDLNNPYTELLRRAEALSDRAGIPLQYREFDMNLDPGEISDGFDRLSGELTRLLDRREELERTVQESQQVLLQLEHVKDLSVRLEDFFTFTYVKFRFGRLPAEVYSTFISHVEERGDTYWFTTSVERDYAYGMYMTPRASMETVDALFSSMQFERIRLSERIHGTGEEAARAVRGESEAAQAGLRQVNDELAALLAGESETFLSRYSFVRYMNDSWGIRKYAAHTGESFYILGWVPESEYEDFARRIERLGNVNFITVADDPSGVPDFAPPVKLSNSKLFRPFESFVSMYGLPSYDEIDPTPLMAITYTVIFGIMFGDVGQGALLILLGFLMHRFKKMWLGPILCYAGLGSVAFGFVYGSVFGYEHILPGFKILEGGNANLALQTAVYLGVFLIVLAISLNIANGIRQRDLEKSVFGPNGLLGLMLYMSVVLLALPIIGFAVPEVPGVLVGAAAGVLVLLVFLREPLSKLCSRRKDWKPHNPVEFLLENVFELFEVLLSYVTNTISFLRMGAYVISHASMMLVVFMLARGTGDSDNLAVVILGNLLVMAIEGLLVGIQVLRLEFYELFGRFYSGGGRAYAPVMIDYRAKTE